MERNKNRTPLRRLGPGACRCCSPSGVLGEGEHAVLGSWGPGSALPRRLFHYLGGFSFFSTDRIVTEQQQEDCYGCFLNTQWEEPLLSFAA